MSMFWCSFCVWMWVEVCNGSSECAGQSLLASNSTINCDGFDSCGNIPTIITGDNFFARGAYSSYNSTKIISRNHSYCNGKSSCSSVKYFQNYNNINCDGSESCFNTIINRTTSSNPGSIIYLDGYKSGAYSTFNLYENTQIETHGGLSLYHATINIYKSSTIVAYQDFSLIGVNLHCSSGQSCRIKCYGYGCANISSATGSGTYNAICAYNYVSNILCNGSSSSGNVVDGITIDFDNDLPSTLVNTLINININSDADNVDHDDLRFQDDVYLLYKNVSNPNVLGINCGNYQECTYNRLNYDNKAICCTAYQEDVNTDLVY